MNLKKSIYVILFLIVSLKIIAFCGFYVAKADADLFNNTSQVIIVRDGDKTTTTMSSDFSGDVTEFAMVVPVPNVIEKEDIRLIDADVFKKLDGYSAPRLAEYYDENPCRRYQYEMMKTMSVRGAMSAAPMADMASVVEEKVKIEAQYTVGEYDVIVLSSTESNALKTWLTTNGYKIPAKAEEVLEPYIKSDMKFFVVKVNLEEKEKLGLNELRPIQMTYNTNKFMLPIRLGMANAESIQDMIVYAFNKKGRVEVSNYKTLKVPTDNNVPEFVKDTFGEFYKSVFNKLYKTNKNSVFLEYGWNLSGDNFVKCDPCSVTPPKYADLKDAGVEWVTYQGGQGRGWGGSDYQGELYFTRLHVRYDRENFPQDLEFVETTNSNNFQARYVLNIAVKEKLDCEDAYDYYKSLKYRREDELKELSKITDWNVDEFKDYPYQFESQRKKIKQK